MRGQLGQVYEKQLVSRVRSFKNTNHRISLFSVVQYEIKVDPLGLSCIRAKSRASSACFKTIRKFAFCDKLWKEGDVLLHSRLSCRRVSRYIRAELLYHAECSRRTLARSEPWHSYSVSGWGGGWLAMKAMSFCYERFGVYCGSLFTVGFTVRFTVSVLLLQMGHAVCWPRLEGVTCTGCDLASQGKPSLPALLISDLEDVCQSSVLLIAPTPSPQC